jgi:hypothetical protein
VPDIQDFDSLFGTPVYDYVGRADEFASPFDLSGPAKAGEYCQLFNALD